MADVRTKEGPSILQLCVAKKGAMQGARVAAFIAEWCIASSAFGRDITREEFAEWWNLSERTVYRDLARFRDVFPAHHDPQRIANEALTRQAALSRGPNGVGSLPASLVTA